MNRLTDVVREWIRDAFIAILEEQELTRRSFVVRLPRGCWRPGTPPTPEDMVIAGFTLKIVPEASEKS